MQPESLPLNARLCKALGIDITGVTRVELTIDSALGPVRAEVTRVFLIDREVVSRVESLALQATSAEASGEVGERVISQCAAACLGEVSMPAVCGPGAGR